MLESVGSNERNLVDLIGFKELHRSTSFSQRRSPLYSELSRFGEFIHSLVKSYQHMSRLTLTLTFAYHMFHFALLMLVVTAPIITRSLFFRVDESLRQSLLLPGDGNNTHLGSVWLLDTFHLTGHSPRTANLPFFHVELNPDSASRILHLEDHSPLYYSPLLLLLYYYIYMMCSLLFLIVGNCGRLTGHISLLQLIITSMELIWYVQHGPSSFTTTFWLWSISRSFPAPWVPFVKRHPNNSLSFHVYARDMWSNKPFSHPAQMEISRNIYLSKIVRIEELVLYTCLFFIVIVLGCFALGVQRVLDAVIGIRPLDVAEGCHRCPVCMEEWDATADEHDLSSNDGNSDEELGNGVGQVHRTKPCRKKSLHRLFPKNIGNTRRHHCPRLFQGAVRRNTFEAVVHCDPLENESDKDSSSMSHSGDLTDLTRAARTKRDTKVVHVPESKKAQKPRVNRSFALPASYGTFTHTESVVNRVPYGSYTDCQDEFRPGNSFPSLEGAGWISRLTYSWLNPLMNFGILNDDVLRHERFLPSLPLGFTSLEHIASPAWLLWVNRWQWFGSGAVLHDDGGPLVGGHVSGEGHTGGDDESSDDMTYVTISQRRPLTSAKLRARRPKKSALQEFLSCLTVPVRFLLGWVLAHFLIDNPVDCASDGVIERNDNGEKKRRKRKKEVEETAVHDKHEEEEAEEEEEEEEEEMNGKAIYVESDVEECNRPKRQHRSGSIASLQVPPKLRRNIDVPDVSLFTLFLEHCSGRRFVYTCAPLHLMSDALSLAVPPIAYCLITDMEAGSARNLQGALFTCGVLFLVLLTRAALRQWYMSQVYLASVEAATAIKALILEKSMALPLAQRTCTEGDVIHLMNIDVARCSSALMRLHNSWTNPCLAIGALVMLHSYVGPGPALATLAAALLAAPLLRVTGRAMHRAQHRRTVSAVGRVELVEEVLVSMRQVKAMGLESVYMKRMHAARQEETRRESAAVAAMAKAASAGEALGVVLTLTCYTVYYISGGALTARVLVPALVALGFVRGAVAHWPGIVSAVSRGFTSMRRIEAYMRQAPDEFLGTWVDLTAFPAAEDNKPKRGTVICQSCSFTWQDDNTVVLKQPVLRDVSMFIRPGELAVVQGPVGSGKSTLLLAVLGEVNRCCPATRPPNGTKGPIAAAALEIESQSAMATSALTQRTTAVAMETEGSVISDASVDSFADGTQPTAVHTPTASSGTTRIMCGRYDRQQHTAEGFFVFGRSVYCSESPWLQNDTIRANILARDTFNVRWYRTVTQACALHEDFATLDKGDATVVGDKGVQLSAGQKARVALARALYTRADVYVLDNVLSTLDARLQKILIDRVFHGILHQRTVILATHVGLAELQPNRLFTVHENGTVTEEAEVPPTSHSDAQLFAEECVEPIGGDSESTGGSEEDSSESDTAHLDNTSLAGASASGKGPARGRWDRCSASLRLFFACMGATSLWLVLSCVAQQVLTTSRDVWLGVWIATRPTSPFMFLVLYFLAGAAAAGFAIPRMRLFFHAVWKSITVIHLGAIERMFLAPVSYFDVNTPSTIAGIFSRSQETADYSVGDSLSAVIMALLQLIAIILFNAAVNPWFVVTVPIMAFLFQHVVERYLVVARQIRHLESRSLRGPVTILREALEGVPVIRCLGLGDMIREEYCKAMDATNQAGFIRHMASCWMSFRLELITTCLTTSAAVLGVVFSLRMPPAFAGIAIVNCLRTSEILLMLCRSACAFQQQFVSVEKLIQLQHAPVEPLVTKPMHSPAIDSASFTTAEPMKRGEVPALMLVDVSAKYRAALPYALRHVSLSIRRGERVGLIGRSGNGKSTVFNLLLRLVDVVEGGGVFVGGVDASAIPYPALRQRFALVPQDPLVVRGSWRANLLPHLSDSALRPHMCDERLWDALRAVRLDAAVKARGGLDAPVRGSRLAAGQRQLLLLARAVIGRPEFILLDELPGGGDAETDAAVHRVLAEELRETTALIIARRVRTLEAVCARVVVIDNGTVAEILDTAGGITVAQRAGRAALKRNLKWFIE